jgi:hypothetical protein
MSRTAKIFAVVMVALLAALYCASCAGLLTALDQPNTQAQIIAAPKTVGGVLGSLGIPVSDAAGALTSTLLAAGFAVFNYFRAKKATAQTAAVIGHVDATRSDPAGTANAQSADSADVTFARILADPLVAGAAKAIIAKIEGK